MVAHSLSDGRRPAPVDLASQLRSSVGRVPPHDLDAEAAVLSAVLLERNAIDKVLEVLKAEHFYSEANRRIYEGALDLSSRSQPIDIVSVAGWLRDRDRLAHVGGASYLAQLADAVPAVTHLDQYARMVREKWRVRQLIATCQMIAAEGYGDVGEVQTFIDRAEQSIYELARTPETSTMRPMIDWIKEAFTDLTEAAARGERLTGTPTGFERLDSKTAGLHDGDLTILAARPGMGKTSLAWQIAANVASQDLATQLGVAFFSVEQPGKQIAIRSICNAGRVDLGKVRQGFLNDRDWDNLTPAASWVAGLPIWLDDVSNLGVLEIRAKVRRLQSEYNREPTKDELRDNPKAKPRRVGLVIIDYLQLMRGTGSNREQEISSLSRGLKILAKELKVPVVALSQLNRSTETRGKDKRPNLSDLRESGAIEQDADNVVFIYRDDYYDQQSELRGIAELIIAKQRSGPTGKVRVRFDAAYTRFDNLAPGEMAEFPDDYE